MSVAEKMRLMKERQAAAANQPNKTPTIVKEEPTKEECPHCGKEFANLSKHINKCKDNPDVVEQSKPTKSEPTSPPFDLKAFMESFKPYIESMIESKIGSVNNQVDQVERFDSTEFLKSLAPYIESMVDKRVNSSPDSSEQMSGLDVVERVMDLVEKRLQSISNDRPIETIEKYIKVDVPTIPTELTMMIDNIYRSWEELREPAERRWAQSTGYLKIINRLTDDINYLKQCMSENDGEQHDQ